LNGKIVEKMIGYFMPDIDYSEAAAEAGRIWFVLDNSPSKISPSLIRLSAGKYRVIC
jgi:hypothetical protein